MDRCLTRLTPTLSPHALANGNEQVHADYGRCGSGSPVIDRRDERDRTMTDNPMLVDVPVVPTDLARSLKPRHVSMISLGGIIGAGLFVGSSGAIAKGGPGVMVVYAAVGLLIFLIMRMLGEMAVFRPGLGSFAEYSALALGPWAGFMTGWLYWYSWVFILGAE